MGNQTLIAEISEKNINVNKIKNKSNNWEIRRAARGILLNKNKKIAIINVSNCGYHKLPGGGIESNEKIKDAFIREIKEETGYECKLIKNKFQQSILLEVRNKLNFFQISYVLFSEIAGKRKSKRLTTKEKLEGFKLEWVTLEKAIEIFKNDKPKEYKAKFIQRRDISILEFYQENLVK